MKKLLLTLSSFLAFLLWRASPAQAQELNYQCLGNALAKYMNAVIDGASGLSNIKLLSPAFNMTSYTFDSIVNAMAEADMPAKFDSLWGIAGNAYIVDGRSVTSWLDEKLKNPHVSGKRLYLTETGNKDLADKKVSDDRGLAELQTQLGLLQGNNPWKVQASLLFNPTNTNQNFSGFDLLYSKFKESVDNLKNFLCGQTCVDSNVGINYATPFAIGQSLYRDATQMGIRFLSGIATTGSEQNIRDAIDSGVTGLIIRIGVGDSAGGFENPADYVQFLKNINGYASSKGVTVYALAGPNEPDSETWAFPKCALLNRSQKAKDLSKFLPPTRYSCGQVVDPEFHGLRPYPFSPCDPLIPRSDENAKNVAPELKKDYTTFSCGNSLTPVKEEWFNPYGFNSLYEHELVAVGPAVYAKTVCEPSESEIRAHPEKYSGDFNVTCWRTEEFDVQIDLTKANLGILNNTMDQNLSDVQKVNEYLAWYLNGSYQVDEENSAEAKSVQRMLDFSGPLRKLLPAQFLNIGKKSLSGLAGKEVHNYQIGQTKGRLDQIFSNADLQSLFGRVPFNSLEDGVGEYVISVTPDSSAGQQSPDVVKPKGSTVLPGLETAPLKLIITKAEKATK